MKKKAGIALAAGLILLCSGCQSANKEEQAEDEVTWVTLFCDVNFWKPGEWDLQEGTITGEITEKTGVAVETVVPAQDADRRLSLMMLENEMPDIISVTDSTVISQLSSSGKVWRLKELLETYCPDSHLLKNFPLDIKQALINRDGDWYAIPSHIHSADTEEIWKPSSQYYEDYMTYNDSYTMIWNRKLLKRLKLDINELQTEEQVLDALKKAAESDLQVKRKPVIPLLIDGDEYLESTLEYLERSFGAQPLDDDGNYQDIIFQPETKHALQFMNTVFNASYTSTDYCTLSNDFVKELIASGRVLCFIGNIANTSLSESEWISSGPILSSEGTVPVMGKNYGATTGWLSTFISRDCENPEKIAEWIDYMTSEEGMLLWKYGHEGEDYSLNQNGLIVRSNQQRKMESNYTKTGIGTWWMFENVTWSKSVLQAPEEGSDEAMYDRLFTAFGKDSHTVIYDLRPYIFSENSFVDGDKVFEAEKKINDWIYEQIPNVIFADGEEEFEKQYEILTEKMYEQGIAYLDQMRNDAFHKNCIRYDIVPDRINKKNNS